MAGRLKHGAVLLSFIKFLFCGAASICWLGAVEMSLSVSVGMMNTNIRFGGKPSQSFSILSMIIAEFLCGGGFELVSS